jgi:serine/threonine-protein kinase
MQRSKAEARMYPALGDVVEGKYRVEEKLGEGGMGAVFRATHLARHAAVALKFMSPAAAASPEAIDRFRNEAVAASEIDCSHVVKIFDVGQHDALPYLVMELLAGHDLEHELGEAKARGVAIEIPRAVHLTLQILRALQVAHAQGVVHRDLKPGNAFVVEYEGEVDFVKLVDFGISKRREGVHLTRTNVTMGTPLYMSPEQARSARDADARSDLYSVAAMLFELLVLRPPLPADDLTELISRLLLETPTAPHLLRPDVPVGLSEVVLRGLAKEPDARYQTARDFAIALAQYADDRSLELLRRMTAAGEVRPTRAPTLDMVAPPASSVSASASTTGVTPVSFASRMRTPSGAPRHAGRTAGLVVGGLAALTLAGALTLGLFGVFGPLRHGATSMPGTPAEPVPAASAPPIGPADERAGATAEAKREPTPPPIATSALVGAPSSRATAPPRPATRATQTASASASTSASASAPATSTRDRPPSTTAPPASTPTKSTLKTMRPDD